MMYKALISFTGLISMTKGDVREISDISLARDLLKAGYIEEIKEKEQVKTPAKVTEKKAKSSSRKGNKK